MAHSSFMSSLTKYLMHIISFATPKTEWKIPRLGIILHVGGQDTGYRLDCEKLFDPADHPPNPLSWFDMDGPWFQKARETYDSCRTRQQPAETRKRKAG